MAVSHSILLRMRQLLCLLGSFIGIAFPFNSSAALSEASEVYQSGHLFTSNLKSPKAEAFAVKDGVVIYVGNNSGARKYVGPSTKVINLNGRFVMPGIIDGHVHPFDAGVQLTKWNLNYEALSVEELLGRIQAGLDSESGKKDADSWFEAVNWFQEQMRPAGVKVTRSTLDRLKTKRPVVVSSSFGHTLLANSRALELAGVSRGTPDPSTGKIWRDPDGTPTGLFEDDAMFLITAKVPQPTFETTRAGLLKALGALAQQGVTSFLDAATPTNAFDAYRWVEKTGQLTTRAHLAPVIEPDEAVDPNAAVARISKIAHDYHTENAGRRPSVTVRNAKLFLDGVISAPAFTGAMLQPYLTNTGTISHPHWVTGKNRGPETYFNTEKLAAIFIGLGRAGIDPHVHADGDRAVRVALDATATLRRELPQSDVRVAIAHDEIVDPQEYPRFKRLSAIPVMSFQWAVMSDDMVVLSDYFGPERMRRIEPEGRLAKAGARIAFGSDWPVDALNEWRAFQLGVTRRPELSSKMAKSRRMGDDPGLTREQVLLAATINAAYELHADGLVGSLEPGKWGDFIILDRNPLKVPIDEISKTRVFETFVGGTSVYRLAE